MGTQQLSKLLDGDKHMVVHECPDKGRYVVSKKALPLEQVLLKEAPYVTAVFDSMKQVVCDHCLASSSSPHQFSCEKCKRMWYCSSKCKLGAKSYHQFECAVMETMNPPSASKKQVVDLKLLVRILSARCKEHSSGGSGFSILTELVANTDQMPPEMLSQISASATYLRDIVLHCKSKLVDKLSVEDLVKLLGIIKCNNFALKNFGVDKHYFGQGIFFKASLLNHSCAPNVTARIRNGNIEFLTMGAVAAGTELNITYTDPSSPSRSKYLFDNYLFECRCSKCIFEQQCCE